MNARINDSGIYAGAYLGMAKLFSYPNPETWRQLVESGLVDPAISRDAAEADYLAAFELGRDAKPVPLFEGMHRGDAGREGILEELLRFYEFFDIKLSSADRDYPDHLVTELEFMAWLCMQEQAATKDGGDADSFRRAARDFLSRHLALWLPAFSRKLEATQTYYAQHGIALRDLVAEHQARLSGAPVESGDTE